MMDVPHPLLLSDDDLLRECEVRRLRRSGPGGQHRNKVETAVQLIHQPTAITAEANERRSQAENQKVALFRLRLAIALEAELTEEQTAEFMTVWKRRCKNGRVTVSANHADFPLLEALVMSLIKTNDDNLPNVAEQLGTTSSQIAKLLKQEPLVLTLVNDRRRRLNLSPLK